MEQAIIGEDYQFDLSNLTDKPQKGDEALGVSFYFNAVRNARKEAETGEICFEPVEYIRIRKPGSRDVVERPVLDKDRERFLPQYRRFTETKTETVSGVPIEQFPGLVVTDIAALKHLQISSIEQLAAASDLVVSRIGLRGSQLRERAQRWLAASKDVAPINVQVAREKAMEDENIFLKGEIESLLSEIERLKKAQHKKGGAD